jgi:hypothetical protein
MPKSKIDRVKLNQMLNSGKSQRDAAAFFGVTEAAISKAKKGLNISVVRDVGLESADKIVEHNLDAVTQLQKINQHANEIRDLLMRWNRGDEEAIRILEKQIRKVSARGREPEWVKEYKIKDPRELALKAMAEIRGKQALQGWGFTHG